jgi:hypothetical protein
VCVSLPAHAFALAVPQGPGPPTTCSAFLLRTLAMGTRGYSNTWVKCDELVKNKFPPFHPLTRTARSPRLALARRPPAMNRGGD